MSTTNAKKHHETKGHTKSDAKKHAATATRAKHLQQQEPKAKPTLSLVHAATDPGRSEGEAVALPAGATLTPAQQITATEALVRITPRALALASSEVVQPYWLVPALAMRNVQISKANVAPFRQQISKFLPTIDLERYDSIDDTALALTAAAAEADKVSSDGEVVRQLQVARSYRGRLLPVLYALAVTGVVPMKAYADIAAGTGPRDTAQDCVDLAAAFRKYASAIEGKHPVAEADLDASAAVGTWLLQHLGTRGARSLKPITNEAVDLRNRVATLLIRDYEELSIVAHFFLRDAYLDAVPPLRSRLLGRRASTNPTPAPPPAPAPVMSQPAPAPAPAPAPTPAPTTAPVPNPAPGGGTPTSGT